MTVRFTEEQADLVSAAAERKALDNGSWLRMVAVEAALESGRDMEPLKARRRARS